MAQELINSKRLEKMDNEIDSLRAKQKKLLAVWEYLAANGDGYVSTSGLKPEFQGICFAGYCVALQHIAFALNLPVDLEDFDPYAPAAQRIRAEFPVTE